MLISILTDAQNANNDTILIKSLYKKIVQAKLYIAEKEVVCKQYLFELQIDSLAKITSITALTKSKEDSVLIEFLKTIDGKWLNANKNSICILPIYFINEVYADNIDEQTVMTNSINIKALENLSLQNRRYIKPLIIIQSHNY